MKSFKISNLLLLFAATSILSLAQTTTRKNPCDQKASERGHLIKETENKTYRVDRVEFFGNALITDRILRAKMALQEGDVFTKALLIKSIENINKSKGIYSTELKDVRIRLDKSNKNIDLVFCIKEKY